MRIEIFEQVKSSEPDELFEENHLFGFESDIAPVVGMNLYSNRLPRQKQPNDIKKGKFEVIRVDYSVNNYINKYELKCHLEVIVKEIKD
jgi:hypothetical protein